MLGLNSCALANNLASIFKVIGTLTSFLIKYIPILINVIVSLTTAMIVGSIAQKLKDITGGALGTIALLGGIGGKTTGNINFANGIKSVMPFIGQFLKFKLITPILTRLIGFMKFLGPIGTIVGLLTSIAMGVKPFFDKWWKDTHRTGTREDLQNVISYLEKLKTEHPDWSVDMLREAVKDKYMMVDGAKVTITFDNKKEIVIQGMPLEEKNKVTSWFEEISAKVDAEERRNFEKSK